MRVLVALCLCVLLCSFVDAGRHKLRRAKKVDPSFAGGRDPTAVADGELDDEAGMGPTAPSVYGQRAGAGGNGDNVQENDSERTQRFNGKGKVTVISNKNTLDQAEEAAVDPNVNPNEQHRKDVTEQSSKANNEMKTKRQEYQWRQQASEFQAKAAIRKESRQKEEATKATLRQYQQQEAEFDQEQAAKNDKGKEAEQKSREAGITDMTGQPSSSSSSSSVSSTAATAQPGLTNQGVELGQGYQNMVAVSQSSKFVVAASTVADGFCYVRGVIYLSSGLSDSFVARLLDPVCAPQARIGFPTIRELPGSASDGYATGRIDVRPDGLVYYSGPKSANIRWATLGMVGFPTQSVSPLGLSPGWQGDAGDADTAWRLPGIAVAKVVGGGSLCGLTGHLKKDNSAGTDISKTLPDSCRVDKKLVFALQTSQTAFTQVVISDQTISAPNGVGFNASDIFLDGAIWTPSAPTRLSVPKSSGTGFVGERNGYRPLSVSKMGKMCILSGIAASTGSFSAKKAIAQLTDCIPSEHHMMIGYSNNNVLVRVDIFPDGLIIPWESAQWISLSGIHYPAA